MPSVRPGVLPNNLRAVPFVARLLCAAVLLAPAAAMAAAHSFYIDCGGAAGGDGSLANPWTTLATAQAHLFAPGDHIALARGSICHGAFAPKGSGDATSVIRLTAYGRGERPRIAASDKVSAALLLFNQEYWQIDSLDVSGGNTYGIFVSGDRGTLHHLALKNLYVHDVQGGPMKNKDNGLVIVGPSGPNVFFNDVLLDGVIAAHTNQWAGILVGGGSYPWKPDAPLNDGVTVRNSSVQDVYGDGIVLFRVAHGLIETSTAWQTGMQPTQDIGTPNAIWTWTCTDCTVQDNEAFLTDSPGVDGGAYDIDWDDTRNTVQRNFAHDTQGYCIAVFAAGYVTSESVVRNNLCVDNGLSPRLATLQGAVYLLTWNGGIVRGLRLEHNRILWNPPVASAAAVVNDASIEGPAAAFVGNEIESTARLMYRSNSQFAPVTNTYVYQGTDHASFTLGPRQAVTLTALQADGFEKGSTLAAAPRPVALVVALRLEASLPLAFEDDGLLASATRAQLMVLRSLAMQYGKAKLPVTVHLETDAHPLADEDIANALGDLQAAPIQFDQASGQANSIRLLSDDGRVLHEWHGFQNAVRLGGAVRRLLGPPQYAQMAADSLEKEKP